MRAANSGEGSRSRKSCSKSWRIPSCDVYRLAHQHADVVWSGADGWLRPAGSSVATRRLAQESVGSSVQAPKQPTTPPTTASAWPPLEQAIPAHTTTAGSVLTALYGRRVELRSPSRGGLGGLPQAPVAASAHTLWEGSPWSSRRLVGLEQCRQGWGSKDRVRRSSSPTVVEARAGRTPAGQWPASRWAVVGSRRRGRPPDCRGEAGGWCCRDGGPRAGRGRYWSPRTPRLAHRPSRLRPPPRHPLDPQQQPACFTSSPGPA